MSDIDIAVADSLKVLDLKRPIREATEIARRCNMSRRARIGLVPFWPNMETHGSEASSRAGLLLVGYLASRCCVNHSVAGPAEGAPSWKNEVTLRSVEMFAE